MVAGNLLRLAPRVIAVLLVCGATACGSSSEADDEAAAQSEAAIARYQAYLAESSTRLVREAEALLREIEADDRVGARSRYVSARRSYGQIKPLSMLFNELDGRIDGHHAFRVGGNLVGFHRVEQILWTDSALAGVVFTARRLLVHLKDLKARISGTELEPARIVGLIHITADKIFSVGLSGVEEPLAGIDLVDIDANLEGMRVAFEAVKSELDGRGNLSNRVDGRLNALEAKIDGLRTPAGLPKLDDVPYIEIIKANHRVEALRTALSEAQKHLEDQSH